jgi:hypothetical protein
VGERAHASDAPVTAKPRQQFQGGLVAGSLTIVFAKVEQDTLLGAGVFNHLERSQDKLPNDNEVDVRVSKNRAAPERLDLAVGKRSVLGVQSVQQSVHVFFSS